MSHRIYVVSKIRHAPMWRAFRDVLPIISSWIDDGQEHEIDFSEAWPRYLSEANSATAMLVYVEPGETLKGGLLEIGAGLAAGALVFVIGHIPELRTASSHYRVIPQPTLDRAISLLTSYVDPRKAAELALAARNIGPGEQQ